MLWRLTAMLATPTAVAEGADIANNSGWSPYQLVTVGITPLAVVFLLIAGKLYTGNVYNSLRRDKENVDRQLELVSKQMLEQVVPALTLATRVMDKLTPLVAEVQLRRERERDG